MAPVVTPINQYLREQTIENCGFLSVPHARIYLIVAKEPLGGFKAIAAKAEDGRREALLSESGANVQEALQRLFLRSAEAVQHHITANGFDFAPEKDDDSDFGSVSGRAQDDDDASTDESLSDNETVSVASTSKANHNSRRVRQSGKANNKAPVPARANTRRPRSRSPSPSTARSASASSSRASSPDASRGGPDASHVRWRAPPHPGYGMQIRPPHMHTPWRSDPNLSRQSFPRPPVFMGNPVANPLTNPGLPPAPSTLSVPPAAALPGAPLPTTKVFQDVFPPAPAPAKPQQPSPPFPGKQQAPTTLLRDVRLRFRFEGGKQPERRVLEQMPLTMRGVHNAAAAYLRRQSRNNSVWPARVSVRQIIIGDVEYDLSGYRGDDLRPLMDSHASGSGTVVPEFEIEVSSPPPPPPGVVAAMGAMPGGLDAASNPAAFFAGADNQNPLPIRRMPLPAAMAPRPSPPTTGAPTGWD
ncbi:hypothetical protein QBC34DRAFT_426321 [Podospora aff. communis PSN243]|uniref:Uncharacterized protein n=1 Tax=Podospora aff. communis PSN243 TaxID=3040156 RepID=A0AAV9GJC6_9PEZI|nr:hypothetical protein QBC34DRAFT_426321 [Podospora aff. communis PSN243]